MYKMTSETALLKFLYSKRMSFLNIGDIFWNGVIDIIPSIALKYYVGEIVLKQ